MGSTIVIDNGSHFFRAGWSGVLDEGEDAEGVASSRRKTKTMKKIASPSSSSASSSCHPSVCERNLVMKPRNKSEKNAVVNLVGNVEPSVLVGLDACRCPVKSPFESNVVCNFDAQETIFDFVFDRLHVNRPGTLGPSGGLGHGVVLTECVLNPPASRQHMAELLFETYGTPHVAMGADVSFAYAWNVHKGIASPSGVAVGMGHASTVLVPFLGGVPQYRNCTRIGVCGLGLTTHLQRTLELRHGKALNRKDHPLSAFNVAERIKHDICRVARDYAKELGDIQARAKKATPTPAAMPTQTEADTERKRQRLNANGDGNGIACGIEDRNGSGRGAGTPPPSPTTTTTTTEPAAAVPVVPGSVEDVYGPGVYDMAAAVERIQIPEIYFQPGMAGIDQMGLTEAVMQVGTAAGFEQGSSSLGGGYGSVLLTGGSSLYPGIRDRLARELRAECVVGTKVAVPQSHNAVLDAWQGAAAYANNLLPHGEALADSATKAIYDELGRDRIFLHRMQHSAEQE